MNDIYYEWSNIETSVNIGCIQDFREHVSETRISLPVLRDRNGKTIFHLLATSMIREERKILEFLQVVEDEYRDRYFEDSDEKIKEAINLGENAKMKTPLMLAARKNQHVLQI
jgi:hypothetical protein